MRLLCYGFSWDDHVIRVSEAVRRSPVGEEIHICTDTDAMVSDMRAFARMTGNRVVDVVEKHPILIDLVPGSDSVYASADGVVHDSIKSWVIVLRILPTNRLYRGTVMRN